MAVGTLTSKGQVTIPRQVRERLRLRAGDRLDFRVEEDGTIRVQPIAKKVADVFGAFAQKASRPYSASEMKRRVRRAFRERKL
jgi:AbrB family looped-hinge helix DNA binding protein